MGCLVTIRCIEDLLRLRLFYRHIFVISQSKLCAKKALHGTRLRDGLQNGTCESLNGQESRRVARGIAGKKRVSVFFNLFQIGDINVECWFTCGFICDKKYV